ncbi:MAG: cytochrome c [Nitrospinota bacterium]|nr:cytochrome c [Nitrospinota bacterium]
MKRALVIVMALAFVVGFTGQAAAGDGAALWGSKKCKNCHNLSAKKKVGPGLAGVTGKRSEEWLVKWLTDTKGTWKDGSAETEQMKKDIGKEKQKRPKMKAPKMTEQDAKDIIAYMKANGG